MPHSAKPPASTGSKLRVSASTVNTGQCSVHYVDHITSGASIGLLAGASAHAEDDTLTPPAPHTCGFG